MIIDTHAHYDDEAFDSDRDEILQGMQEHGVGAIINVGADLSSTASTIALARRIPFLYAAAGVHPSDVTQLTEETFAKLKQDCRDEKVAAIGEIGLDYHWPEPSHEIQKTWFRRQLQLADELDLPVSIHSRDAAQDTLRVMQDLPALPRKGSIHCFSYSKEIALIFQDMGYFFGIGGVITFHNARKLREAVEVLPLERLLLETDCPYLAPEPYRGSRNCSYYLQEVAEAIAQIKGVSKQKVIDATRQNAIELFRLPEHLAE